MKRKDWEIPASGRTKGKNPVLRSVENRMPSFEKNKKRDHLVLRRTKVRVLSLQEN